MTELALISFILICVACIIEDILHIKDLLPRRYSYNDYGIAIVLDIAWIFICVTALLVGGTFASAAISLVIVWIILGIIGDFFAVAQYSGISDGIGLALRIVLLVMFLSI